jgi:hypothetical protein
MMVSISLGRVLADKGSVQGDLFVWLGALGKILTMDNLRKQHIILVNKCCTCKMNEKYVDLLLHSEVACAIWIVFHGQFGLS